MTRFIFISLAIGITAMLAFFSFTAHAEAPDTASADTAVWFYEYDMRNDSITTIGNVPDTAIAKVHMAADKLRRGLPPGKGIRIHYASKEYSKRYLNKADKDISQFNNCSTGNCRIGCKAHYTYDTTMDSIKSAKDIDQQLRKHFE